jgi:putative ABC transport system permease protein
MRFGDTLRTALGALRLNLLRSSLTTLGVVIGIAAVILGVGLGNGVQAFFDRLVGPLAVQIIITKTPGQAAGAVPARDLRDDDVLALRDPALRQVNSVTPVVSGSAILRTGSRERRVTVLGSTGDYFRVTNRELERGRFASLSSGTSPREVVLGPRPVRDLFDGDAGLAVGRQVRLARTTFTVVGVLRPNSQQDDVAVIPLSSARTYLFGNSSIVNQIIVQARGASVVDAAMDEVGATLDRRHHVTDPERRDFDMASLQTLIEQRQQFLQALRMFIAAVATISLVVGGIGVANIMLVSITERTREIGIRKALGATRQQILEQFLLESSVISGLGGVVGVLVGVGLCSVASVVLPKASPNFPAPVVSGGSVVVAFGISVVVGILAGLYPANHAARMRIIEALRYE